jgi:hypothetical protein
MFGSRDLFHHVEMKSELHGRHIRDAGNPHPLLIMTFIRITKGCCKIEWEMQKII